MSLTQFTKGSTRKEKGEQKGHFPTFQFGLFTKIRNSQQSSLVFCTFAYVNTLKFVAVVLQHLSQAKCLTMLSFRFTE